VQHPVTPGRAIAPGLMRGLSVLLVSAAIAAPSVATPNPTGPLPLGAVALAEARTVTQLAPGVRHHHIVRGTPGEPARWVIALPPALSGKAGAQASKCLARLGLAPARLSYRSPGRGGRRYTVAVGGAFASQTLARASLPASPLPGCRFAVQNSAAERDNQTGPWSIHIIEIDPVQYRGRMISALGNDLAKGGATTTALARDHGALAAINGGFFAIHPDDGTPGEPAGLSVTDGRLRSESTAQRHYLLLDNALPVRAAITLQNTMPLLKLRWTDGQTTRLDGIDRPPGVIRNCGVRGGKPSDLPAHDLTCSSADELVLLTPQSVAELPPVAAIFFIRADGRVERAAAARRIGDGEMMLAAIGVRIGEVAARVRSGARASVDLGRLGKGQFAVNGGPLLLHHGRPQRHEAAEGWAIDRAISPERAAMLHGWINRRNPRTAAGVTRDGRIILLTVDGRGYDRQQPANAIASAGMTIDELRSVMAHLGAVEALNLDGGGSTAMVVGGRLANRPSDLTGERRVGDAILLVPPCQETTAANAPSPMVPAFSDRCAPR
jgi:hypothetical protein